MSLGTYSNVPIVIRRGGRVGASEGREGREGAEGGEKRKGRVKMKEGERRRRYIPSWFPVLASSC